MNRNRRDAVFRIIGIWLLLSFAVEIQAKAELTGHELANSWNKYRDQHTGDPPAFKFNYESCFRQAASQNDLPYTLLLAVARGESDFNPRAVSKANAIGIMQILWPSTAKELGINQKNDLFKPCTNIRAGSRYLKFLLDRYSGDYHLALAAYNYGPHRIKQGSRPSAIPKGAQWYSAYVYDHLQYVLGKGSVVRKPLRQKSLANYSDLGKYSVIVFNRPFRARAFRGYLQDQLAGIRFDWFDKGLGRYEVVMSYQGEKEFRRNLKKLRKLGLNH